MTDWKEWLLVLVGKKLDALHLACEMMMFSFERYQIHAQCLTRIIKDHDILVTTQDYQNWDGEDEKNNDEWFFVDRYRDEIIGGTVVSLQISPVNDVKILLDNGVEIELFIENGYHHYGEKNEQWVFFKHRDHGYPFVTVYNKSVNVSEKW